MRCGALRWGVARAAPAADAWQTPHAVHVHAQALAADVAEELAASGQAADAAAVLLNYLGDVDNAVRTYVIARYGTACA